MHPSDMSRYAAIGEIEILHPNLEALLDPGLIPECIAKGFSWTEGPAWDVASQRLLFSDIPENTVHSWSEEVGCTVWLHPAGRTEQIADPYASPGTNGLWINARRQLLICNQDARSVDRLDIETGVRSVVARNFEGMAFNSPNDVVQSRAGIIYFTDPPFGLKDQHGYAGMEMSHHGVYAATQSGELTLAIKDMRFPNGLVLSPDGKTLYVSQSDRNAPVVKAYDVAPDGTLSGGRTFYDSSVFVHAGEPGLPDGMTVDRDGNLFATVSGGVAVISPEGQLLGRIATGKATSNCTFGEDGTSLFITAHDCLIRVRTRTAGLMA